MDAISNDDRLKKFMEQARERGRQAAAGKDSLPIFALEIVKAASEGVITSQRNGDEPDDAYKAFEAFTQAANKKALHERTDGSVKAQASKARQLIKFGEMTTVDAVAVLDRTVQIRNQMVKDQLKVKPAYAAYVDIARVQQKQDSELSDEQITSEVTKPVHDKTLEGELEAITKKLEKIIKGDGGIQDQSQEVIDAHDLMRTRLAALIQAEKDAEFMAELESRGLTMDDGKVVPLAA